MNTAPDSEQTTLAEGTTVGHYRILAGIDEGGMGAVFRALDLTLGRQVALKRPRAAAASDAEARHRFLNEARAASVLAHPNIVPVFEVFEHEGTPWIAMELVEGRNLADRIRAEGPLPPADILRYAGELAGALGDAHAHGILHRDIKPRNVLIGSDGRARLADFGLARRFAPAGRGSEEPTQTMPVTRENVTPGTPPYMSPEQVLAKPLDQRSDIFSLGIVLYEMCSGKVPFASSDRGNLANAILNSEPAPLATLNHDVPPDLEAIIRRCLAKRPENRYQDASRLLSDLKAVKLGAGHPWGQAVLSGAAVVLVALLMKPSLPLPDTIGLREVSRPLVAVLPVQDRTGEIDGDLRAEMFTDLLVAGLGSSRHMRCVGTDRTREILAAAAPHPAIGDVMESMAAAGPLQWLVSGRLYRDGADYVAHLEVHPAGGAETAGAVVPAAIKVSASRIGVLPEMAVSRLRDALLPGHAAEPVEDPGVGVSDEARLLLQRGRRAMRESRYMDSIADLQKAVETDPRFIAAWVRLAEALDRVGYGRRAGEAAEQAVRVVEQAGLAPSARISLEARAVAARVRGDLVKEVEAYRALVEQYPDDPDVQRALGSALESSGRAEEALTVIREAVALDPADGRAHLQEARCLARLKQRDASRAALDQADRCFAAVASAEGHAKTLVQRGYLEYSRGAFAEAGRLYREAKQAFKAAGLEVMSADAAKSAADMALKQGDFAAATPLYELAAAQARRSGDKGFLVRTLGSMGSQLYFRGQYNEGEHLLREALDTARTLENDNLYYVPLMGLAGILNRTGRVGEGRGLAEEALALARRLGQRPREASALYEIANAEYQVGRLEEAARAYRDMIQIGRSPEGGAETLARGLVGLASTLATIGVPGEALEAAGECVDLHRKAGNNAELPGALLIRAGVRAELALWEEAEADLAEAEAIATRGGRRQALGAAIAVARGWLLLARGDAAAAEERFGEARRSTAGGAGTGGAGAAAAESGNADPAIVANALIGTCWAALQWRQGGRAEQMARRVLDRPDAPPTHRSEARACLAQALAASGDPLEAIEAARRVMDESGRMGQRLVAARAALAVAILPTAQRPADADLLIERGRAALLEYLSAAPEERRPFVRSRPDLKEEFNALVPAPSGG